MVEGSGLTSVVFNVSGKDLTFPGDLSPRNISNWLDGRTSKLVELRDENDKVLPPELWDQFNLAFRAVLVPLRENEALLYLCVAPISLEKLRLQCAHMNTDLNSIQVPCLNLPIGDRAAQ